MKIRTIATAAVAALGLSLSLAAQTRPAQVPPLRLYVFENGFIRGLDTKQFFNLAREELKEPDFVNSSYLIVHPRGTLQFEAGGIPDSQIKGDGSPTTEGVLSATKTLLSQLANAGYRPSDITYFALSHYHSDHTGNANAFAGSTWITQKAERDFMFSDKPQGIIQPATYSALKGAKTRILDNEELDVFGDGTVRLIPTPGHTPGHQVLLVRLPKRGPVLLAGDLYHYPEERAKGITPTFEFNAEMSKASRAKVEALLKETKAQLWIEHDLATHATLPKPPAYVE
jgi:glyoxylase-like metal-dependent hydrolase (beta-lactamase superfamily II)